jgi:hypothetical protein
MDLAERDLTAFAAKPTPLNLTDPADRKKFIGIRLYIIGRDSDEYKQWAFERADARAEQAMAAQRRKSFGPSRAIEVTAEEMYEDQIDEAVFLTRGWDQCTNLEDVLKRGAEAQWKATLTVDGQELDFNTANRATVLRRFKWMVEQAQSGAGDRALFVPASATN